MTTHLEVHRSYPLRIEKVREDEVLTHDLVTNGRYARTGGIAVEINFNNSPMEGRILLFNVCTSHRISINKENRFYQFHSEKLLNDCFDDGNDYYQACSVNSLNMVFQDFVFFKLEQTWRSVEYDLNFTSFIVHEQNDALIPVSSFNWFLKANCSRDENNLWQLTNSTCSNFSDILRSQLAYSADEATVDFRRLDRLFDKVERWRQEVGV